MKSEPNFEEAPDTRNSGNWWYGPSIYSAYSTFKAVL